MPLRSDTASAPISEDRCEVLVRCRGGQLDGFREYLDRTFRDAQDVLDRLLAGSTDYASLRPDRWAASHPEHLRTYRTEERRDRAAAQHSRRAHRRAARPATR